MLSTDLSMNTGFSAANHPTILQLFVAPINKGKGWERDLSATSHLASLSFSSFLHAIVFVLC
jgi:hypothetical protein